jgi:hypothetical protein
VDTCTLVVVFVQLVVSVVQLLNSEKPLQSANSFVNPKRYELTFGKLTFGTTTILNALGASLAAFFALLPGGYFQPSELSVSHGFELGRIGTADSEFPDVGFLPKRPSTSQQV